MHRFVSATESPVVHSLQLILQLLNTLLRSLHLLNLRLTVWRQFSAAAGNRPCRTEIRLDWIAVVISAAREPTALQPRHHLRYRACKCATPRLVWIQCVVIRQIALLWRHERQLRRVGAKAERSEPPRPLACVRYAGKRKRGQVPEARGEVTTTGAEMMQETRTPCRSRGTCRRYWTYRRRCGRRAYWRRCHRLSYSAWCRDRVVKTRLERTSCACRNLA